MMSNNYVTKFLCDERRVSEVFTQTEKCSLMNYYERGAVRLGFYGGELASVEINGVDIEDEEYSGDINVIPSRGCDDELCYRLDEIAAVKIANLAGIAGVTIDGVVIYNHPEGHSHRPELDAEVISNIRVGGESVSFIDATIDLGRIIGYDHLVKTHYGDEIVFHQRGNRPYKSRMVLNRMATPTQYVTVIICKCGDEDGDLSGKYALVTLYEGKAGMPEPYGSHEGSAGCVEFWAHHALVPTEKELTEIMMERSKNND